MAMDIGNPYADWYYGYEYDDVEVPEYTPDSGSGGGEGGGVTEAEMNAAINAALNSITVSQKDEDTTEININGNTSEIDDVYLTGVERDDDTNEVVFSLNNGKDPIRVNIDELDNPNIDGSTF